MQESRVSTCYNSTNAWWRLIHVPFYKYNQKWVDFYNQPCTFEYKLIIANNAIHAIDDILNSSYHCHNKNIATDYIVKVLIIAHNEVYAFDHSLSYLCLLIIQTLPSIILNYALELECIRANLK